jgi:transcription elongation factor SPT4
MQKDEERVASCTSAQFDGLIAMANPEQSWVARWQRIGEDIDVSTLSRFH